MGKPLREVRTQLSSTNRTVLWAHCEWFYSVCPKLLMRSVQPARTVHSFLESRYSKKIHVARSVCLFFSCWFCTSVGKHHARIAELKDTNKVSFDTLTIILILIRLTIHQFLNIVESFIFSSAFYYVRMCVCCYCYRLSRFHGKLSI